MRLLLALLTFLVALGTAEARVVALLFDDSGSMGGRLQLPAFGAQLLVSTLDGRLGEDRLIAARMSRIESNQPIEEIAIETPAAQQKAIDAIATRWPVAKGGTPYQQIELLLAAIARIQKPGEEAFLIIFTDGVFEPQESLPPPAAFKPLFEGYKGRMPGPLRAEFMLIDAGTGDLLANVEAQGVRSALLETFNGDAREGRHDVTNSTDMIEAVKDIVARVASTDRRGQNRFLKRSGTSIAIDTPLSIRRIVVVATAGADDPPSRPGATAFAATARTELVARMRGADTKGRWAGETLAGHVTHFVFQPRLPAGIHEVPFDKPPGNAFLLFQTGAALRLSLHDEAGQAIPALNGIHRIPLGAKVVAILEVIDETGGQAAAVPLARFGPGTELKAAAESGGQVAPLDVRTDAGGGFADAALPTDHPGPGTVQASLRIEGFVSTYARPITYEVVEVAARQLAIELAGVENCPTCAADQFRHTITAADRRRAVAKATVTVDAPIAGRLELALEGAPLWLTLASADGKSTNVAASFAADTPTRIDVLLVADVGPDALTATMAGPPTFTLKARLADGPTGEASASGSILLAAAAARLAVTGNTQDPTGKKMLTPSLPALTGGSEAIDLALVDALTAADEGTLTVESDAMVVGFETRAEADRIAVVPRLAWWCGCFIWLDVGTHPIRLTWTGPNAIQSATATAEISIRPRLEEYIWTCALLLALAVLVLYLAVWLLKWHQARRFPRRSGVAVQYGRRDDPIFRQLRRWDWTPLKALLWPVWGAPHESRVVEGLALRAARGGAEVLLDRSAGLIKIAIEDRTIAELIAENPRRKTVKMNWHDFAQRSDHGLRTLTILQQPEDMTQLRKHT